MGIIRAAAHAVGGGLADQWLEVIEPENMGEQTVFSAGVVKDTADNYNLSYATDEEFEEYIQLCRDTSNYDVDVEVNKDSQIVSLSTCTNVKEDERFLLQGVLTEEVGGSD